MWKTYLENNLYRDYEGFYELPYYSNSPQLMVDSVSSIPGCFHNEKMQTITTDNPFLKGIMQYVKLDEGLSLCASDIIVHKNIISKAIYDPTIVSDYYFLNFSVFEYRFPTGKAGNDFVNLISKTCNFYKPQTSVHTYFYQQTNGRFYNIAFTKDWLEQNVLFNTAAAKEIVLAYLNGKSGFINWLDIMHDSSILSEKIWNVLQNNSDIILKSNTIKDILTSVINDFFNIMMADGELLKYKSLANEDYSKVAAAERIILGNLSASFVGVDAIASAVHVSPTKLKSDFKKVFGFSMLQYHKEKNMLLAMQLLKKTDMQVKNIASICGYISLSKFTATFKKRFQKLPSTIR